MNKQSIDAKHAWLILYFILNLTLTLYNKALLINFKYPWTLTAIHTLCGSVGCYLLYGIGAFVPTKLTMNEQFIMLMFSFLYTINIAISNVSLNLVSVAFHQVVRAMTPVFTIILSVAFLHKTYSRKVYTSLLPVVLGVGFATFGEYDYSFLGLVLTLLGTVLAAIKTIVTNRVQVGRLKLDPMDLLLRMSPLAFVQCMVYAYMTGELAIVKTFSETHMTSSLAWSLFFNGVLAFALNIVSFTANKKTGPLTMTVAGNVKQVLSIILAVVIFDLNINYTNAFGIILTLVGGGWYGKVESSEKSKVSYIPTSLKSEVQQPFLKEVVVSEKSTAYDLK